MALFSNVHHRGQPNLLIYKDQVRQVFRSRSIFARGCDELKRKLVTMPMVQPTPFLLPPRIDKGKVTSIDDRRRQISEENGRGMEGMSEVRRERREIIE